MTPPIDLNARIARLAESEAGGRYLFDFATDLFGVNIGDLTDAEAAALLAELLDGAP